MTIPHIPPELATLVRDRFNHARDTGALFYWPTQCSLVMINDVPFQIRFSEAIAKKPKAEKSPEKHKEEAKRKPFDPFENPTGDLLVAKLEPSHVLVLNKFAIIPEHIILATKEYKLQTHMLEEADIGTAYACIETCRASGHDLFAFFNSGDHSGASQPHRHIQFLPMDGMAVDMEDKSWKPLADSLAANTATKVPFAYFSEQLHENITPEELHRIYLKLHKQACDLVLRHIKRVPEDDSLFDDSDKLASPISYNLALTHNSMVLCPRRAEGKMVERENPAESYGPISLNGTLLGGTLLVRNYNEWDGLRENATDLLDVLETVGLPPPSISEKI